MRAIAAMGALALTVTLVVLPADTVTAQEPEVAVVRDLEIPTSSGNVLRGDLYQPVVDGEPRTSLPTIVTYFPYAKDDSSRFEVEAMHRFAEAGYAGLLVDIAGTGVSPGEFGFLSEREIRDGHDVVVWAGEQSFSSGRVGLWGYSYPGITAGLIAATRPDHLEAAVPASAFHDAYRDVVYPGGILTSQDGAFLLPWLAGQTLVRQRQNTDPQLGLEALLDSAATPGGLATLAEAPLRDTYDEYWKERSLDGRVGDIEVPTLLWGGWNDVYPRGTLINYREIGTNHKRLVMGPWGHLAAVAGDPFELFMDESIVWFDRYLRSEGRAGSRAATTGVRLFDFDWAGEDVYADVWPGRFTDHRRLPRTEEQTLQLCTTRQPMLSVGASWPVQGQLVDACGHEGELPVPTVPADLTGGGSIGHDAVANRWASEVYNDKDQRLSVTSAAMLSDPLDEAMTLTGPMTVELSATTLGVDTDWVVRVVDVGPDRTRVIAPGWLRASRRHEDPDRDYLWHTHDRSEMLTPGEPYRLRVEVWPTSYRIPEGHRLGLIVRTADTLKVMPSVGSAVNTLLTGPEHRSSLTFSVRRGQGPKP